MEWIQNKRFIFHVDKTFLVPNYNQNEILYITEAKTKLAKSHKPGDATAKKNFTHIVGIFSFKLLSSGDFLFPTLLISR